MACAMERKAWTWYLPSHLVLAKILCSRCEPCTKWLKTETNIIMCEPEVNPIKLKLVKRIIKTKSMRSKTYKHREITFVLYNYTWHYGYFTISSDSESSKFSSSTSCRTVVDVDFPSVNMTIRPRIFPVSLYVPVNISNLLYL